MNFPVNMNLVDSWNDGFPYLQLDNVWRPALKVYKSLDVNATWESIKDLMWIDLIEEDWNYQRISWREVI